MLWLIFYQPGWVVGYERLDSFAIVDNREFYFNDRKLPGTVTNRETLEQFLVDHILKGQPVVLRVDQLPGWEQAKPDTRSVEQIF